MDAFAIGQHRESPSKIPTSSPIYNPKVTPKKRQRRDSESSEENLVVGGYACQRRTPLHCPNDDLVRELQKIERARKLEKDERSLLSYEKAIAAIRAYPKKISSASETLQIKDIGPKISHMEFLMSGVIKEAQDLAENPRMKVLDLFQSIYGVGATTAKEWYARGFRTIEDLKDNEVLKPNQSEWVKYFVDLSKEMSRKDGMKLFEVIKAEFLKLEPEAIVTCVGGFRYQVPAVEVYSRRGKPFSKDLDILITHPVAGRECGFLERIVTELRKRNILIYELMVHTDRYKRDFNTNPHHNTTDSLDKCFCLCIQPDKQIVRQVDLIVAPIEAYPVALFGWTGSKQFERSVRSYAKKQRGIHITNTGIYNNLTKERIDVSSEEEIFKILGLEYLVWILRASRVSHFEVRVRSHPKGPTYPEYKKKEAFVKDILTINEYNKMNPWESKDQ